MLIASFRPTHIERKKVLWIILLWMRYASQCFALFFTSSGWHCNRRLCYKFSSWYLCSVGGDFLIRYIKPYPSWLIWFEFCLGKKTIHRIRMAVHYYVLKSVSSYIVSVHQRSTQTHSDMGKVSKRSIQIKRTWHEIAKNSKKPYKLANKCKKD